MPSYLEQQYYNYLLRLFIDGTLVALVARTFPRPP